MAGQWRSRLLRIAGAATLAVGTGLVITPPAGAAAVADADELRAAISGLNGTGPAAEIELKPGVTYELPGSAGCDDEDANKAGDLDIRRSQPLKIFTPDGQAPAVLSMTCGDKPQRVIEVLEGPKDPAGKLTLRNVVIKGGVAPTGQVPRNLGGGVLSLGDVAVENATFDSNAAGRGVDGDADSAEGGGGGSGGAIAAAGKVAIDGSTFTGNRGGRGGDGLSREEQECNGQDGGRGGFGGQGGAVLAIGGLTITGSTFTDNKSGDGGDGGDGACGNADKPEGGNGGGGGAAGSAGAVQCGLLVTGRESRPLGCTGPMVVRTTTMAGNSTGDGGDGGNGGKGWFASKGGDGGDGGAFEANGFGGAIVFLGGGAKGVAPPTLLVENSTLDANSTGAGGKGGNGGTGGNASNPEAVEAGASADVGATVDTPAVETPAVETPTVETPAVGAPAVGTAATPGTQAVVRKPGDGGNGGDGGRGGQAGAIVAGSVAGEKDQIKGQIATLVHVTATDNGGGGAGGQAGVKGTAGTGGTAAGTDGTDGTAGKKGGGSVAILDPWRSVASIIGTAAGDGPDCIDKAATTATHSVSTDATCGFGAGNTQAFDGFGLGALADNGGPNETRLPAKDSALVDKVPAAEATLTVDQRGVARPQAGGADIGAVEIQDIDLVVTKTASASSVLVGTEVTFTITAKNGGTSSPKPGVTVDDPKCTGLSTAAGDTNNDTALDPGETFTYTCKATPTAAGKFTNTATVKITDGAGKEISRTATVDVEVTAPAAPPAQGGNLAATGYPNLGPTALGGMGLILAGIALIVASHLRRRAAVRVVSRVN